MIYYQMNTSVVEPQKEMFQSKFNMDCKQAQVYSVCFGVHPFQGA